MDFQPQAKTRNAVHVIALIVLRYASLGFRQILCILDNCSIHNDSMKAALAELLAEIPLAQGIAVDFLHTPAYSPSSTRPNTSSASSGRTPSTTCPMP
ncbi:hypothetical protein MishRS11D_28960 [Methylomagnum ishizawai]|nr:hypothetical protein MishRS11D_28960 [Methylomagnum ishizawai]